MKKVLIITVFGLFTIISIHPIYARSGCCSHHNGVCGCGCCDGSPLSSTCLPYYPECSGGGSIQQDTQTYPTLTSIPTQIPYIRPTLKPTKNPILGITQIITITSKPISTPSSTLQPTKTVLLKDSTNVPSSTKKGFFEWILSLFFGK